MSEKNPNPIFISVLFFFSQTNHEQALQDAAKKSNRQKGEIEEQIAEMKVKQESKKKNVLCNGSCYDSSLKKRELLFLSVTE